MKLEKRNDYFFNPALYAKHCKSLRCLGLFGRKDDEKKQKIYKENFGKWVKNYEECLRLCNIQQDDFSPEESRDISFELETIFNSTELAAPHHKKKGLVKSSEYFYKDWQFLKELSDCIFTLRKKLDHQSKKQDDAKKIQELKDRINPLMGRLELLVKKENFYDYCFFEFEILKMIHNNFTLNGCIDFHEIISNYLEKIQLLRTLILLYDKRIAILWQTVRSDIGKRHTSIDEYSVPSLLKRVNNGNTPKESILRLIDSDIDPTSPLDIFKIYGEIVEEYLQQPENK